MSPQNNIPSYQSAPAKSSGKLPRWVTHAISGVSFEENRFEFKTEGGRETVEEKPLQKRGHKSYFFQFLPISSIF